MPVRGKCVDKSTGKFKKLPADYSPERRAGSLKPPRPIVIFLNTQFLGCVV